MESTTTAPSSQMSTPNVSDGNYSTYEYYYDDEYAELGRSLNIMSLIIYCVAFLLGVLGNGLVIWVTGFRMKKTVVTVWFLNLAVADFLFTASLPLTVTYLASDFHWPFGRFMCKLNTTISILNIFASVYILMVISVDRCVAVVWPIWSQNHRSVRKASCVSLGVWVLALMISIPFFVFRDTAPSVQNEEYIVCFNNYSLSNEENEAVHELTAFRKEAMTITQLLLGFVVPFTVIISCYSVIIHRLRRNRTLASQSTRTFKIIAAVITTFFCCWAPFYTMILMSMVYYKTKIYSKTLDYVINIGLSISTGLACINSCLNPLLYVFVGQDFRDKVRKSILKMLEAAFHEDVSDSHTGSKPIPLSTKERSDVSEG